MMLNKQSDDLKSLKIIFKFFKKYPRAFIVWIILMYLIYILI
jgi:hypothetical protein